jgi:F-type H+-transporting ATPase subunit a
VIFLAVGFIEVISIIFRPVSLTFRLFGNVFGGESLLHSMFHLGHKLGFPDWLSGISMIVVPIPFYMLEVLIGIIQALVFMLLVAVYIGLICNHGDEEEHH